MKFVAPTNAELNSMIMLPLRSRARSAVGDPAAATAIREAEVAGKPLFISSVSIVEVTYLTEKGHLEADQLASLLTALRRPDAQIIVTPFDLDIAETLGKIPRLAIPDMPDRMIAATAVHLNLPLVTVDAQIRASGIETIW